MKHQKEIEALDFAIEVLQKKKEKLQAEQVQTLGVPGKDPLPPDPTHPNE